MDAEKLQKLAAGRKKLKSYQKEKTNKESRRADDEGSSQETTHESGLKLPQIQTYFNIEINQHPPAANFFDDISTQEHFTETNATAIEDPEINPNLVYDLNSTETNTELSNTESLRQLSSQIHQLIEPCYENQDNFSDLEKRNLELATLYEAEKLKCSQLAAEMEIHKTRAANLERDLQIVTKENEHRIALQMGPMQEQLQCHMQTVGILVGEKTELQASLNQTQIIAKQKTSECEELTARLKTSRSRVADLEKELSGLKEAKTKSDQLDSKYNNSYEKLRYEFESQQQDIIELREKLRIISEENARLTQNLADTNSQLSLANVKIQQLTVGGNNKDDLQFENMVQENLALEKQIADLNVALKNTVSERDQASLQYQQYVQQLNINVSNLAQKLEVTITENEGLQKREQDLIKHVGELEKRLQTLQNECINFVPKTGETDSNENIKTELETIQSQHSILQEQFKDLATERDDLLKEVERKKLELTDLESTVEQMTSNQTDNSRLLAAIESNQVAASRAVEQNAKLKQQLEEMQTAYIKMTNDKAELVDKLTSEEFKLKDLEEKLHTSEHQLHTLAEAINIKDQELTLMRENSDNLNKQVLTQNQLADRLRHYEANENSSHVLINDLQDALRQIEALKQENSKLKELKTNVNHHHHNDAHHDHADHHNHDDNHHDHTHNHDEGAENHSDHVHGSGCNHDDVSSNNEEYDAKESELQNEIFNLKQKIDELEIERDSLRKKLNPHELDNSHLNDINKELATRQLEAKFMRTMQDIANLQDEKQMLEHLVLQLQGETETIGEYIALYQHQRGVLKQRAHEKEVQLKQLAKDREQMKIQLGQLNELVARLVNEKGISIEALREHEELKKQTNELCDVHAKLHKEMQDTTDPSNQEATAKKIMALLTEIKSSNLVQPADVSESFHPCPWCSGQLITV